MKPARCRRKTIVDEGRMSSVRADKEHRSKVRTELKLLCEVLVLLSSELGPLRIVLPDGVAVDIVADIRQGSLRGQIPRIGPGDDGLHDLWVPFPKDLLRNVAHVRRENDGRHARSIVAIEAPQGVVLREGLDRVDITAETGNLRRLCTERGADRRVVDDRTYKGSTCSLTLVWGFMDPDRES